MSRRTLIVAIVAATAFLLVKTTSRSLLLAMKAAVLDPSRIGAAYGVAVTAFPWGWRRRLIGVSENVPIESYGPMNLFAIVLGLLMDYEVFLLSRVKESWDASNDHAGSEQGWLATTTRAVTRAALSMVAAFAACTSSRRRSTSSGRRAGGCLAGPTACCHAGAEPHFGTRRGRSAGPAGP